MLDLRAGFKGCIKGSSTCFCVRILFKYQEVYLWAGTMG